jgi:hypothetical protein
MPYLELDRNGIAGWDHVTQQVDGLGFLPLIMAAISAGQKYMQYKQADVAKGIAKGQAAGAEARDKLVSDAQAKLDAANAAKAAIATAEEQASSGGGGGGGGFAAGGNSMLYLGIGAATLVALALATRR